MTTLRGEADRYRDRGPPRLNPRRQELTRRVDRSEREEYDDYDRVDIGRDDYIEDGRYYGGGCYAPEKFFPSRSMATVMICMVMKIAPRITVVGRVFSR